MDHFWQEIDGWFNAADLYKGAEVYILARLNLLDTKYVMFEYHSERNRMACNAILTQQGFALLEMNVTSVGYGVAKYQGQWHETVIKRVP